MAGITALAGEDRSYIYGHPDLLDEIRTRRSTTPSKLAPRPAADRATIATLQARLASAHEEIARLKAENRTVRGGLTNALGDTWEAKLGGTRPRKPRTPAAPANVQAGR